jgi:hypothetical protein
MSEVKRSLRSSIYLCDHCLLGKWMRELLLAEEKVVVPVWWKNFQRDLLTSPGQKNIHHLYCVLGSTVSLSPRVSRVSWFQLMARAGPQPVPFTRSGVFSHYNQPLTSRTYDQKVKEDVTLGRRAVRSVPREEILGAIDDYFALQAREMPVFARSTASSDTPFSPATARLPPASAAASSATPFPAPLPSPQPPTALPSGAATSTRALRTGPKRLRRVKAARPVRRPPFRLEYFQNSDVVATGECALACNCA